MEKGVAAIYLMADRRRLAAWVKADTEPDVFVASSLWFVLRRAADYGALCNYFLFLRFLTRYARRGPENTKGNMV